LVEYRKQTQTAAATVRNSYEKCLGQSARMASVFHYEIFTARANKKVFVFFFYLSFCD